MYVLQCVTVCCSVLQCVAACCNVLQRVADVAVHAVAANVLWLLSSLFVVQVGGLVGMVCVCDYVYACVHVRAFVRVYENTYIHV